MIGYSPKIPLQYDITDGYYKLNKTFGEVVKQNIKMIMLTSPGERIMDPNFGVGIRNSLFDSQPVILDNLKTNIISQIKKYAPYAKVIDIKLRELQDTPGEPTPTNSLALQLIYVVPGINLHDKLTIKVNSGG